MQSFDHNLDVHSAGTEPGSEVNKRAVSIMAEEGIDISWHYPKNVAQYIDEEWDHVITVCDHARETCPVFTGKVRHQVHIGFDDPSQVTGSEEYIRSEFIRVRDEIRKKMYHYYQNIIRQYKS